jgi:pentatricopeptide repeat protein
MGGNYQKPHEDATAYIALLKSCLKARDLEKCRRLHAEIASNGLLQANPCVGSTLVHVYAKCETLSAARGVFDQLRVKDVVSWTALISGYAKHGLGNEALHCFDTMVRDGTPPNSVTFLSVLKACACVGALEKGEEIHGLVLREGLLGKDVLLGSSMVDMYAKCGAMSKAQALFDQLPVQDVICWNALIAGYAQHGPCEKALSCADRMRRQGVPPDEATFVCILKACSSMGASEKGKDIHAEIVKEGFLEKNVRVGNALVNMYSKCGELAKAQEVFEGLSILNTVSWNAVITGYAQHGYGDDALRHFMNMRNQGFSPNAVTFVCILKACGCLENLQKGKEIHVEVMEHDGVGENAFVATGLLDMYAKCGDISRAQEVLSEFPSQESVSYNALISGCAKFGHDEEALNCFNRMQHEGFPPDAYTFTCILKVCGSRGAICKGKEIHATIIREEIPMLGCALVDMYAKCGELMEAQEVFDELQTHDIVCWTSLITGYAQHECIEEALNCFEAMRHDGILPDAIIFVCVLKACGSIGAVRRGMEIHSDIRREGLLGNDNLVGNALVDMYARCGELTKAHESFDELPCPDVSSWNSLILGYSEYGQCRKALDLFWQMQNTASLADASIFCCIFKACAALGEMDNGKQIHALVATERALLEKNASLGNALVDMYTKCSSIPKAEEVLDGLVSRDVATWNTVIAAYVQRGDGEEALACFDKMAKDELRADSFTFVCILKACGIVGALDKGQEIHGELVRGSVLDMPLGTALVEMYARCGCLVKALEVFDELPARDVVSWTVLLAGFAHLGDETDVFRRFESMLGEGLKPDALTFTVLLNACCHSGRTDAARMCFETMVTCYDVSPAIEHYTCMIDVFSRARRFDEAISFIAAMPRHDCISIWAVLLGACQQCRYHQLGEHVFEHAMQLDEMCSAVYVCMSNIYATATTGSKAASEDRVCQMASFKRYDE